jgi:hypothetical protein
MFRALQLATCIILIFTDQKIGRRLKNNDVLESSTPSKGASISNIYFNGSASTYCCGSPIAVGDTVSCPSDSDNDGKPLTVTTGKVIPGRALLANVPSLSSASSTGINTSSGTTSNAGSCQTCHDTAIGAGVGVSLGALALLFVIWAIIERRRASRLSRVLAAPGPSHSTPMQLQSENIELSENTRKRNIMVELEGGRPELDGGDSARD